MILDDLANYAKERVKKDKEKVSLEEIKELALSPQRRFPL